MVVDLHCDLLLYLACNPDRTPHDLVARCAYPQLQAGKVEVQVLAIYGETGIYSLLTGLKQIEIFQNLPPLAGTRFIPAFENASAFCLENEPLQAVFHRLENILKKITPLYISLTWNGKNRFGGGTGTDIGLKKEGEELLQFLSGRGIAIDFSHASDRLATEILNCIDRNRLDLRLLASHSNFRSVENQSRNLPDEIAREIIQRKGLIGLVFYDKFLKSPQQLHEHIKYGLQLGGEKALAFGADFFCLNDFQNLPHKGSFFPEMADSSHYPWILKTLKEGGLAQEQIDAISSKNFFRFHLTKNN